jgi:hypothetical protein
MVFMVEGSLIFAMLRPRSSSSTQMVEEVAGEQGFSFYRSPTQRGGFSLRSHDESNQRYTGVVSCRSIKQRVG